VVFVADVSVTVCWTCFCDQLAVDINAIWPHHVYVVISGDSSIMQVAVDQQITSSTVTPSLSSLLPSDATEAIAAFTLTAAGSEPQPAARFDVSRIFLLVCSSALACCYGSPTRT